jgi:alanine dehydrogenase
MALTNATLSRGLLIADKGLEAAAKTDPGLAAGINSYRGKLTFAGVAESLGLSYTGINTLI